MEKKKIISYQHTGNASALKSQWWVNYSTKTHQVLTLQQKHCSQHWLPPHHKNHQTRYDWEFKHSWQYSAAT